MKCIAMLFGAFGVLAANAAAGAPRAPLIVNVPAEHFFVSVDRPAEGGAAEKLDAFSNLWAFKAPKDVDLSERGVERYVDALAGGKLTHCSINVNYQRPFFPAKTIEPIWTGLSDADLEKNRYVRSVRDAFARGLDVYAVMIRRCRERGVSPWLSFRMNDIHGTQRKSDPMVSAFWKEHPEWHLGDDASWENGLDYAQKPVRDRMAAFIREALERYDADGVELDFIRFPHYFRKGTERANAPILTAFLREIRAICDAAAKRRGRPVKIAARFLPDPAQALAMGADVGVWSKEGLLDVAIACNMFGSIEHEYHVDAWRKTLTDKTLFVAGTDNGIIVDGRRRVLNLDEYNFWIDKVRKGGADGVYFFNFPLRPYRDETWRGVLGDGKAEPFFLKAAPVWAVGREDERNAFLRFRATFERKGDAVPELRVTASAVYRARLNGAFLGYGPARSIKGEAQVDVWPLAAAREGGNELEIEVCSYNEPNSFQYHAQPGFLQAEVACGGKTLVATPNDFTASELPRSRTEKPYSHQRRFPTERWVVGGETRAQPLGPAKGLALAKRAVPYPTFAVNDAFRPVAGGEPGLLELPFVDSGFVGVRVTCEEPVVVTVRFDEALVKGRLDPLRNGDPDESWHAMHNVVTWNLVRPGEYALESFEPYSLKYAKAEVSGGKGTVKGLWVRQMRSPAFDRMRFTSSDPDLNAIFAAARNSLAENAVDIFTDCPGRERSGWLCDSRFSATAMALLTGDVSVERHHLLCYARSRRGANSPSPSGALPPNVTSGCFPGENFLSTYLLWFVIQCDDYVRRAGPGEAGETFKAAVKERVFGNVEYLKKFENADGLLENLPGWVFVEWSRAADFTKGVNYAVNALWSRALDRAGDMYGRADWREQAARVRACVARQSFDGAYFRDHAMRNGKGVLVAQNDRTETCQYYQFVFGVATPESHPDLWKKMLTRFGPGLTADGLFPSDMFFGRFLRLELLARAGLYDQAVKESKAYFAPMARESGTLWEFVDGHDSRCHAFGSYVAAVLLPGALGIREIDRVRRVVRLDADAVRVSSYDLTLPSAEGDIHISFGAQAGTKNFTTRLPPGWVVLAAEGRSAAGKERPKLKIALTFDDGTKDHMDVVAPLLAKHGWKGTFNVVTGIVGTPNRLTWDDVRELRRQGHEIASHTVTHPDLVKMLKNGETNAVIREYRDSRAAILRETGKAPRYMCYPFSARNDATDALCREAGMAPMSCARHNFGKGTKAGTPTGVGAMIDAWIAQGRTRQDVLVHGVKPGGGWFPFDSEADYAAFLDEIADRERKGLVEVVPYDDYAAAAAEDAVPNRDGLVVLTGEHEIREPIVLKSNTTLVLDGLPISST